MLHLRFHLNKALSTGALYPSRTVPSTPFFGRTLVINSNSDPKSISNETKPATTSLEATSQYRKGQLNKLENKFKESSSSPSQSSDTPSMSAWLSQPLPIDDYDDVQPMWKDMESRVLKRKLPPKLSEVNNEAFVGRRNIRKTDEEAWLEAGLYNETKIEDAADTNTGK